MGDCAARASHVRRLCVCRRQGRLSSPGRRFQVASGVATASTQLRREAEPEPLWSDSMGHLSRFGRPLVAPNAEWAPHKIAIVLVTTPSRRARPSDLEELRLTLASLSSVDALRPHQVDGGSHVAGEKQSVVVGCPFLPISSQCQQNSRVLTSHHTHSNVEQIMKSFVCVCLFCRARKRIRPPQH